MTFHPEVTYKIVHANYKESIDCDLRLITDENNFFRFCEKGVTENVFIVFQKEDIELKILTKLQSHSLSNVSMLILPDYLKILYLENGNLYKFDINDRDSSNISLIQNNVISYFEIETLKFYFIDDQFKLYLKDTNVKYNYTIKKKCKEIYWYHIDDIFFICLNSSGTSRVDIKIYLAQYDNFQQLYIDSSNMIQIQLMSKIQHLIFYTFNRDQNKYYLISFRVLKILLTLTIPKDKRNAKECEYFMKNCSRYDIGYNSDTEYSIFKFEPENDGDYSFTYDFLYRSKKLESVDWKYLEKDNFIKIDDYISGFVKQTCVSSTDTNSQNSQQISNDTFDLSMENTFELSIPTKIPRFSGFEIQSFVLSSTSNFISCFIYQYLGNSPVFD
jgi:hypothetical protein